jgi:hypothetical protein
MLMAHAQGSDHCILGVKSIAKSLLPFMTVNLEQIGPRVESGATGASIQSGVNLRAHCADDVA